MAEEEEYEEYLESEIHKLNCSVCGRKILVTIGLIGIGHNAVVIAECGECIKSKIDVDFAKREPQKAEEINRWLNDD